MEILGWKQPLIGQIMYGENRRRPLGETLQNGGDQAALPVVTVHNIRLPVEVGIDQHGNPGGIFSRKTTITNPLGGNFSRQIVVTVNWKKNGLKRKIVLQSMTQGGGI